MSAVADIVDVAGVVAVDAAAAAVAAVGGIAVAETESAFGADAAGSGRRDGACLMVVLDLGKERGEGGKRWAGQMTDGETEKGYGGDLEH